MFAQDTTIVSSVQIATWFVRFIQIWISFGSGFVKPTEHKQKNDKCKAIVFKRDHPK